MDILTGTIEKIIPDDRFEFKGFIIIDDGKRCGFSKDNWLNKDLSMEDITVGAAVEFVLKPPNKKGFVYANRIRFVGESVVEKPQAAFDTNHSYGSFNSFVCLLTPALMRPLAQLVEDFAEQEYTIANNLFRKIATTYNSLQDADFIFFNEKGREIALFPSGFVSKKGKPIYLFCVKNTETEKSEWVCDRLFCDNHVIGGSILHDTVNSNWYEVVSNLKELIPSLSDDIKNVVQNIEDRCMIADTALIWLKDGCLSTEDSADHLYVPSGYTLESGEELYLSCSKKKGIKGYGWYFDCITYENAPLDVYDKNSWLERWAEFDWKEIYPRLENQTLEERWSFGKRDDYGILRNYLIYTFAHQWKKGAVGYTEDYKYAAFNTGLPDKSTYEYLYAFYEKIEDPSRTQTHPLHTVPQYRFKSFIKSGRGGDGKILSKVHPLPSPPQYFAARSSTVWELDFDDNNQVTVPEFDDLHILIQRCDRLPLEFYRWHGFRSERFKKILEAETDEAQKYREIREFLMPVMSHQDDGEVAGVYHSLYVGLRSVIETAVKRLSWNWRAVVPCYNPEREESCFLLPVSFWDSTKPDRAMIASVHEVDGNMVYAIHTVISLEWAYLDARLVCRPESEWLAADNIS